MSNRSLYPDGRMRLLWAMLSYQHSYHAGNHADMLKHAVLARLIARLLAKDKPLSYIDTHAGAALYRLDDERALKTGEAKTGLERVLAATTGPEILGPWLALVRENAAQGAYPGSPEVARRLLRPGDRLELMELHPAEHEALVRAMAADSRVHVHRRDGFAGLVALTPPDPRRGFCLIDPSYETDDDWLRPAEAIVAAARKWPAGIFALWYPVVPRRDGEREALLEKLRNAGIPGTLRAELHVSRPEAGAEWGMAGSGLVIVRSPWRLDEDIALVLDWLRALLADDTGFTRLDWLVPPA